MTTTTTANPATNTRGRVPSTAMLAALFTVVAWASAFVAIRAAGEHLSPGPLSLLRIAVAAAALGVLYAFRRDPLPARADLPRVVLYGTIWFGLYTIALNAGERTVDAGSAAMLVGVGPILIAIFAGLLLGEGFPRSLLVGCAIAFAGIVLIGIATSDGLTLSRGVGLCLVAAAAYATGVLAQKPLLARSSPLAVTFAGCLAGLVVCLPFAPALVDELGDASAGSIAWVVYLGIVPTALAFTTWGYALARTTAGRMGAISYLVLPIAVLLGWVILDETPPALALVGGGIVLAGVIVSRR